MVTIALESEAKKLYLSGMSQADVAKILGRSQNGISVILKRLGVKTRPVGFIQLNKNQFGENNRMWKGRFIDYGGAHDRVSRERGKPKKCEVCKTESAKLYDWANMTGDYSNPKDYKRMCRSCHFKHDGVVKNFGGSK